MCGTFTDPLASGFNDRGTGLYSYERQYGTNASGGKPGLGCTS